MMITQLFGFNLPGKNFYQKILRSKTFKKKLRHQVGEAVETKALRVKAEAIQKLQLPHSWF